jgi:hypothetical protein
MPRGVMPLAIFCLLVLGPGPNSDLAALAIGVLITGILLLFPQGEAPVLLFSFSVGWIGAAMTTFYGNWLNMDVAEFAPYGGDTRQAVALSLIGLLFMAVGMRVGRGRPRTDTADASIAVARSLPSEGWFRVWILGLGIASIASIAGRFLPDALGQLILGFANLKWAFYFILAYASFVQKSTSYLYIAFVFELLIGISGFFSDFKTVFLVTLIAFLMANARLKPQAGVFLALGAAMLLTLGVIWSTVKNDYRNYVSGGSMEQAVTVDFSDRIGKFSELIGDLDQEKLINGIDSMVRRVSYVEFFGLVLEYVPISAPHSNGEILLDAIIRPFTPRILFPNKTIIDDTERTNKYAGRVAANEGGTSISLGYVAESFIDFGWPGMFGGLMVIGLVYGLINRWLLTNFSPIFGNALATAILLGVGGLENSVTKIFGGVVATLIASWILNRYVVQRFFPQLRMPAK